MAANSMTDSGAGRGRHALAAAYMALLAMLLVLVMAVSFLGDPHAGDPVVVMELHERESLHSARPAPISAVPVRQSSRLAAPTEVPIPLSPPQETTRQVYSGGALVTDPSLIENTPAGPLPRVADDGTTPMRAYAPPVISDGRPRIAIVIGGLGISAKSTEAALKGLPSGVTLAFAPYAADVQHWVAQAREQGHEILLEIPMEPYDLPASDPGLYTLRSGVGQNANTERMVWALTRFSGYAGVTNLLGGRFLADADSLEPVLKFLSRRGVMFYDNGAAIHSVAPAVAARIGIPFVQSVSTIDKIQTAMEIDRQLLALENAARLRGSVSGSGRISPVTIDRVRSWAQRLSERGFVLAPASAIVAQSK
jgi:polysaccharide deacetylase 2 family uncharacterized protein YibQ